MNDERKNEENRKLNSPTRLRSILYRHVKELNPSANCDKIDALEEDIKLFIQATFHNVEDLGLEIKPSNFIGDMD